MRDNNEQAQKPLWPDDEAWLVFLEPAFEADPETAGCAANMWDYLSGQLSKDHAGRKRVKDALEQALRLTYPYTPEFQKAYEHWRLSLEGDMAADDEPLCLLQAAIDRTKAASERARKREMTEGTGERPRKTKKTMRRK